MKSLSIWIRANFHWANPLLTLLVAIFGAFLTFDLSEEFTNTHQVGSALIKFFLWILPVILPVTGLALLYIQVDYYRSEASLKILMADNERLNENLRLFSENIRNLFEGYLYRFGAKIGFGTRAQFNERVTLYIHNDTKNTFVPCGRYSANPKYKGPGRPEYPHNSGCISISWEHGWCFDNRFPSDADGWHERNETEYGLSRAESQNLTMQSRLYAAMRVNASNDAPIAVIVVESLEHDRWSEEFLKSEMEAQRAYICELVVQLRKYIPQLSSALAKGF
jgi:hypothetical protein